MPGANAKRERGGEREQFVEEKIGSILKLKITRLVIMPGNEV